jgi:hypothetical protein
MIRQTSQGLRPKERPPSVLALKLKEALAAKAKQDARQ